MSAEISRTRPRRWLPSAPPHWRSNPAGQAPAARPVRVPTVLQMEALECGAAALAMVLAHHGRYVPLEELREACGVSRDGSKASNLLRAARSYGLIAKGFKKEPAELQTLPLPAVIHWNFNHFVVLEGFRRYVYHINDPARGPARVSEAEFDRAFTGVVLSFEPGPAFRSGGRPPSLLRSLFPRLQGSAAALLFIGLAGLALVVPGLVAPVYARIFVDDVLVKSAHAWLVPLLLMMAATALVTAALSWLQQHYLLRLEMKLALNTSARFLWHVLGLPIGFFAQRFVGDVGHRVGINDRIARLLAGDVATTALSVLLIAFYAALLLQYDLVLTAIGITLALVNVAALRYFSRKRVDLNQRLLQDRGKLIGVAMGGLQTIETLKASGAESDFFARWSGHLAKAINAGQQYALTTQLLTAIPPFLLTLNIALILGIGGLRVIDGHLSMGMLVAVQALMLAFIAPVNRLVALGGVLQEVRGDMSRLDDVLRAPSRSALAASFRAEESASAPALRGHLELRDVSFGYNRLEPPLIAGFDLTIRPGERVALIGGSGCGKSTIARLIAGLYEPWSGEILFDGRPRNELPAELISASLALVDQEIFLFEATVRDNLTLWDDTVSDADLTNAVSDACLEDELASRPGRFSAEVEEGGRNFSGGQRQRLEIARALAGNPAILLMDEATSALDPVTEQAISENLSRRGCTCLLVAHRLSTIRDANEIIVLDAGRIVQRGPHDALIEVAGPYRDLVSAE